MKLTVFLSGEIHSDWREEIISKSKGKNLPLEFISPITNHDASDNVGAEILGAEESAFWKDHKATKINAMRIKSGIEKADIVIVKFGEKYRQWNAAFDAGYASALGKSIIVIHPEEFIHALKEIDGRAMAVANNQDQVVDILEYVALKD